MPHGPIRREPRRDVAPRDAIRSAIGRRKQEQRVGHGLAQLRENAGCAQYGVSADRKDDARERACDNSANASTNTSGTLRFAHDSPLLSVFIGPAAMPTT